MSNRRSRTKPGKGNQQATNQVDAPKENQLDLYESTNTTTNTTTNKNTNTSTRISHGIRSPGVSEATRIESQAAFKAAVESGEEKITLNINGRTVEFTLETFKAGTVKAKTGVVKANARFQKNLNRYSLSDILSTLKEKGQTFNAIGYRDEATGVALVFDGSRRRMSCIIAGLDFRMYVTDIQLSAKDIRYVTRIASVQKELSIFEYGAIYDELLRDGVYDNQAELADGEGLSKTTVSNCLGAFALHKEFTAFIPDLNAFGRNSVKKAEQVIKLYAENEPLQLLWDFIATLTIDELQTRSGAGTFTGNKLNATYIKAIEAFVEVYKPKKTAKRERRDNVASNGKRTCFMRASKHGFSLDIEHIEDDKKAAILAAIKDIIHN